MSEHHGGRKRTGSLLWKSNQRIVLIRDVLRAPKLFGSTLLHEIAHARSDGSADLTEPFEAALTVLLGDVATHALDGYSVPEPPSEPPEGAG